MPATDRHNGRPESLPLPMSPYVVLRCTPADRPRMLALSQRLGLAFEADLPAGDASALWVLELAGSGLCLQRAGDKGQAPGATRVDFMDPALLHRLRTSGKRQGLGQALGLLKHPAPCVLDATAGLGRDALLMAHLGCQVLMLERSPLVHALLEDGLQRAHADAGEPLVHAALQRLALQHGEARDRLEDIAVGRVPAPEIVYLDPMFPPRNKSALVKKDMALLQELLGAESDLPSLMQAALRAARRRVVVKRPTHADASGLPRPTFTVPGKTAQFDVYELSSRSESMRS